VLVFLLAAGQLLLGGAQLGTVAIQFDLLLAVPIFHRGSGGAIFLQFAAGGRMLGFEIGLPLFPFERGGAEAGFGLFERGSLLVDLARASIDLGGTAGDFVPTLGHGGILAGHDFQLGSLLVHLVARGGQFGTGLVALPLETGARHAELFLGLAIRLLLLHKVAARKIDFSLPKMPLFVESAAGTFQLSQLGGQLGGARGQIGLPGVFVLPGGERRLTVELVQLDAQFAH
jgi:hypothetical protein